MKLQRILYFILFIIIGITAYSQEAEEKKEEPIEETYNPAKENPNIYVSEKYINDSTEISFKPAGIVGGGEANPNQPSVKNEKGPQTPKIINVGSKSSPFEYINTINMNTATNGYSGHIGNDVYYQLTLSSPMDLIISHEGSSFASTTIYLIRVSDFKRLGMSEANSHDLFEPSTLIARNLAAGTYYVISEGVINNMIIKTTIKGNKANSTPYIVDTGSQSNRFTLTKSIDTNTMPNGYQGRSTNDIFYKMTLTTPMEVVISHCGSVVNDTYVHLLDKDFNRIAYNDDAPNTDYCSNRLQSYLKMDRLEAGTYYVVSEGYSQNGVIKTTITGVPFPTIISAGTRSTDFYYSHTQNTENTKDAYQGKTSNDIFYKLILSKTMDIIISHCGSEVSDTYVTLLDANYNRLAYNDDYSGIGACGKTAHSYLKKENLDAGTYYIVSEGYSRNGNITTTIEGYLPKMSTAIKSKTSTESYVQTLRPLVVTTDATKLNLGECMQTVQYFDGFARPTQTIQAGIVDNGYNLVSQIEYDEFGRESRQWIPFRSTSSNATKHTSVQSSSTSFHGDTHPYTEIVYDNPALSRVAKTTGPGAKWYSAGKGVKQEYTFNTASGILSADYYTVNSSGTLSKSSTYKAGELFVEKITDENGNISYLFTDKSGKVILERQMNGTEQINTYHVYDELDRKRYVLPPMMNGSTTTDNLNKYAYSYKYDERGNCIEKKLPGADPMYYVYDKANRLIFTQNGNQRQVASNLFTVTKYDKLGRIIYTAEGKFGEHTVLVNYWKDHVMSESFSTQTHTYPMGDTGYSKGYHHLVNARLLTVYYYDTYDFLNLNGASAYKSALTYSAKSGYGTRYSTAIGMLTGMRVYDSQYDNSYTTTAYYYDYKGDEIQVLSTNHLQGGYEKNYYKRGFTGNVEFHLKENTATGKDKITELYEYKYDQGLRVKNVIHQLNNQEKVMLAQNKYNSLGILSSKAVNNSKHTTTYTYHLRGWTTAINGIHFKQNLTYGTYNGNITEYNWKVSNEGFTRLYRFNYDALNRLTKATYGEKGTSTTVINNNYTVSVDQYDKQGNIQKIKRYGAYLPFDGNLATTVTTPPTHKYIDIIDNLTMTYNGNQLTKVVEAATKDPIYNGVMHFSPRSTATTQYTYDRNGNLTSDRNKNVTDITYNNLNQPTSIMIGSAFGGGLIINNNFSQINYSYDALGNKYQVFYIQSSGNPPMMRSVKQMDYCGNIIYRDGKLDKILTSEGYVDLNSSGKFVYHYYLKDHQGNNRVVLSQNSVVEQVNHYYPFGALFGDSMDKTEQTYKYNGKELDRMFGLDIYDYHARGMDPVFGRFTTIDPLAELYYSTSPYAYCLNNPIKYIDPDGKSSGAVIGGFIGAVAGGIKAYKSGGDILAGAVEGGVAGAITGAAVEGAIAATIATGGAAAPSIIAAGALGGAIGGAAGAFVGDMVGQVISQRNSEQIKISFENTGEKVANGAISGAIGGAAGGATKVVTEGMTASTKAIQATMSNNIESTGKTLISQGAGEKAVEGAFGKITQGMTNAGSRTLDATNTVTRVSGTVNEVSLKVLEGKIREE